MFPKTYLHALCCQGKERRMGVNETDMYITILGLLALTHLGFPLPPP